MLSTEQIEKNKASYLELLKRVNLKPTKDESNGYDEVAQFLENINFFKAPYTAQYSESFDGGLCSQTLRLVDELARLANIYFPGRYTEQELLSLGLFVNLYRAIMYEKYKRNTKNDKTGKWEAVDAYRVKEERPTFGDIGFSSYMIMRRFVDFSDEVVEAFCNSSISNMFNNDIYDILKSYPLVSILKMAVIATDYIYFADHSQDVPTAFVTGMTVGDEVVPPVAATIATETPDRPFIISDLKSSVQITDIKQPTTLFSGNGKEVIKDSKDIPEIKKGTTKTDFEYKF